MSLKQKSHNSLQINPTENRVEYAQLKRFGENISTRLTLSDPSDVKSYNSVGTYTYYYTNIRNESMSLLFTPSIIETKHKPTRIMAMHG